MSAKYIYLFVALVLGALAASAIFYAHNNQDANVKASSRIESPTSLDALAPSGPAFPPPLAQTAPSSAYMPPAAPPPNPPIASETNNLAARTSENSVLIPSVNQNQATTLPAPAPNKVDADRIAMVPVGQAPVQYVPVYPHRAYARKIVVKKHHHGKVHVARAVKHLTLFSLKLPFKLRP